MKSLNHELHLYVSGSITWDKFVYHAIQFIDALMLERHHLGREERSELISDFYPRLQPLVDNYHDRGSSFEGYLASTLYHYCRAHIRRKIRLRRIEAGIVTLDGCTEEKETPPALIAEAPLDPLWGHYEEELKSIQGPGHVDTLRRQLLFVFCKNVPLLDGRELDRYSKLLDLPVRWIQAVLEYATRHHAERLRRRTVLRERRDAHYAAMIMLECTLKRSSVKFGRRRLAQRYDYHRRLWLEYVHRLRVQNVHLSHRDLAALFGISKGSIDSAVFVLTRRLVNASASS